MQGIVASTEESEFSLFGNFLDPNQTFSNETNLDQLSCVYRHIITLVRLNPFFKKKMTCRTSHNFNHFQTNLSGCPPTHDSALCWPPTPFNTLAIQRCDFSINGIHYDIEGKRSE